MKRKTFDPIKLHSAVRAMEQEDATSSVPGRATLMDAVRAFFKIMEARQTKNWTYEAMAALLTNAGYPINAATLRSYMARLRNANDGQQTINPDSLRTPIAATKRLGAAAPAALQPEPFTHAKTPTSPSAAARSTVNGTAAPTPAERKSFTASPENLPKQQG